MRDEKEREKEQEEEEERQQQKGYFYARFFASLRKASGSLGALSTLQ